MAQNAIQDFERRFFPQKIVRFLKYFFCRSKEAYREWQIETSRICHFQRRERLSGRWRNRVARPSCLDAILVFLLKTTSIALWPAEAIVMSIQPYQLQTEYPSSEKAEEDSQDWEGRRLVMSIFEHMKDAGRIFLGVFVKDVQSCQVKVNMCCKELSFL